MTHRLSKTKLESSHIITFFPNSNPIYIAEKFPGRLRHSATIFFEEIAVTSAVGVVSDVFGVNHSNGNGLPKRERRFNQNSESSEASQGRTCYNLSPFEVVPFSEEYDGLWRPRYALHFKAEMLPTNAANMQLTWKYRSYG